MAHDQDDNSLSTDQLSVGEHFAFVYRQIIRFIQYSWNCAFLDKE